MGLCQHQDRRKLDEAQNSPEVEALPVLASAVSQSALVAFLPACTIFAQQPRHAADAGPPAELMPVRNHKHVHCQQHMCNKGEAQEDALQLWPIRLA